MRARPHEVVAVVALVACGRDALAPVSPPSPTAAVEPVLRPPDVPEAIRAPAGQAVIARASGEGFQIYECRAAGDAGFAWQLVAPDAVLLDASGQRIGRHYAGPTWEGLDGSKVVGALQSKVDAPPGGGVPWLLLAAKFTQGAGLFAGVTTIQRVDTVGGVAPAKGCNQEAAGARQSVPYRATYYFYAR